MRKARMKMIGTPCYYHCYNKSVGDENDLPFDDVAKEYGMKLLVELVDYFLVEPISATFMGNHFHVVLHAPAEVPTPEVAAKRHNDFHDLAGNDELPPGKVYLDPVLGLEKCQEVAEQMVDVSCFMKMFQQRFTVWRNRLYKRRGTTWAGRFKSTILEGSREALWNCVKYVELNPVRAGIVDDPADYRFCSWGRYCGSGKHPFAKAFTKHMRAVAEHHAGEELTAEDVLAEFRGELARIQAWEDGKTSEEIHQASESARVRGDSMRVRFLRRTRHWTDGAIIGGKTFVQEVGSRFDDPERVKRKQLSRGDGPDGPLYCFRRLRAALE